MTSKLLLAIMSLLIVSTAPVQAKDEPALLAANETSADKSDTKKKLAEQYLQAAGWDTQIKSAFEKQLENLTKVSDVTTDLSPVSDKEKQRRKLVSHALQEVFKEIDLTKECRDIMIDLLIENFDESELKTILDYALSPTGKKATQLLPQLSDEGAKLGEMIYGPKIDKALYEAIQEETNQKVLEK